MERQKLALFTAELTCIGADTLGQSILLVVLLIHIDNVDLSVTAPGTLSFESGSVEPAYFGPCPGLTGNTEATIPGVPGYLAYLALISFILHRYLLDSVLSMLYFMTEQYSFRVDTLSAMQ